MFMTPDAFKDDWYGELTNQCGHTFLGIVAAGIVTSISIAIFGEPPLRIVAFLLVVVPYAVLVEWLDQGWLAGDSWFDTAMVGCGALGCASTWHWVEARIFELSVTGFLSVISLWALLLGPRVYKRWRRGLGG